MATFDALTGLPNRVLLADRLQQAMTQCVRRDKGVAVAFIDLHGLKKINDHYGHDAGDEFLAAIAQRMKTALREGDSLGCQGGDEFVAVLVDMEGLPDCEAALARLLEAASSSVTIDGNELHASASIGVTFYPDDWGDADQLIRHADEAMYIARRRGENGYLFFDVKQEEQRRIRHETVNAIARAIDRCELELFYQPEVNMRTGAVIGAESLVRWRHPQRGLVPPAEFIPQVEGLQLSVRLGEWVIDAALAQLEAWKAAGFSIPVSVNIGDYHLQRRNFATRLQEILAAHPKVKASEICLEILETSGLADGDGVLETLRGCLSIGLTFALDDFGTGYSSFTRLRSLPIAAIKIDKSFVLDMIDHPSDRAVVESVIALGAAFDKKVIAEGVETIEHGELLLSLGCEFAQGYAIARPMPAAELPGWIAGWRVDPRWSRFSV